MTLRTEDLAARLGLDREEVVLISAAAGSMRLLVGLPPEAVSSQALSDIRGMGGDRYAAERGRASRLPGPPGTTAHAHKDAQGPPDPYDLAAYADAAAHCRAAVGSKGPNRAHRRGRL
jgi:hypothetical protein